MLAKSRLAYSARRDALSDTCTVADLAPVQSKLDANLLLHETHQVSGFASREVIEGPPLCNFLSGVE